MRIREKMKHQTNVILSFFLNFVWMHDDDAGMGMMARGPRGACTAAPWHHHFGRGSASKPPRARWAELARSLRDVIKRGRGLCNRITYSGHGGDLCAPVEGFWSERAETDDEAGPAAWSCSCSLLLLLLPLPCPPPFPLPLSLSRGEGKRERPRREGDRGRQEQRMVSGGRAGVSGGCRGDSFMVWVQLSSQPSHPNLSGVARAPRRPAVCLQRRAARSAAPPCFFSACETAWGHRPATDAAVEGWADGGRERQHRSGLP